jgi:hypothetical protein
LRPDIPTEDVLQISTAYFNKKVIITFETNIAHAVACDKSKLLKLALSANSVAIVAAAFAFKFIASS